MHLFLSGDKPSFKGCSWDELSELAPYVRVGTDTCDSFGPNFGTPGELKTSFFSSVVNGLRFTTTQHWCGGAGRVPALAGRHACQWHRDVRGSGGGRVLGVHARDCGLNPAAPFSRSGVAADGQGAQDGWAAWTGVRATLVCPSSSYKPDDCCCVATTSRAIRAS